jgi:ATP-dependent Clp protease ATP-binding subunit ClpA
MIAQELEVTLHMAFMDARQKRHEFISVEHLLMAMLDNPSAVEVLRACGANIEAMREQLGTFIEEHTPKVVGEGEVDTQPTLGFQRVIQRAILHVQSSGKKEVTGANVLVAVFGEKDSHAVYFLTQQGVTRLDIIISHASPGPQGEPLPRSVGHETKPNLPSPLDSFAQNLNTQALAGKIDPHIGHDQEWCA